MPVQIALLRAVNVGGNTRVSMSDLRAFFVEIGFADARTLLQTGNVVFTGTARKGEILEEFLRSEAKKRIGLDTDFLVRAADQWEAVIAANPFPREAQRDPGHLLVVALTGAPETTAVQALQAAIKDRETVHAVGKHLYVVYPDGIGRSRLTMALIERKLCVRGTGRNWNTVLKLGELARTHPSLACD